MAWSTMGNMEHYGKQQKPGRIGDFFWTYSGIRFFPHDPRVEEVKLVDIWMPLGNMCRWQGHLRSFYSVAEHLVRCTNLLEIAWSNGLLDLKEPYYNDLRKLMFLHDAAEAYVGDVIRPEKRYIEFWLRPGVAKGRSRRKEYMGTFYDAEGKCHHAIAVAFGVAGNNLMYETQYAHEVIKLIDTIMLVREGLDLHPGVTPADLRHAGFGEFMDHPIAQQCPIISKTLEPQAAQEGWWRKLKELWGGSRDRHSDPFPSGCLPENLITAVRR